MSSKQVETVSNTAELISTLKAMWEKSGVGRGDILLLHSSLSHIYRVFAKKGLKLTADIILDSFLDTLGPHGTLMLPLFNFGFAKGVPFDIRNTPSEMGALTEAGRQRSEAIRTGHPIYSFAVIGAKSHRFQEVVNFSGYGPDSPFALLRELDGRIGILGLEDQHSMTFYHHVEEMLNVPYRYHKSFRGAYIGWDGIETQRDFGLFVRRVDLGIETDVNPMGEILWARGLYHGFRPRTDIGLRTIKARDIFDATAEIIRSGRADEFLYRINSAMAQNGQK